MITLTEEQKEEIKSSKNHFRGIFPNYDRVRFYLSSRFGMVSTSLGTEYEATEFAEKSISFSIKSAIFREHALDRYSERRNDPLLPDLELGSHEEHLQKATSYEFRSFRKAYRIYNTNSCIIFVLNEDFSEVLTCYRRIPELTPESLGKMQQKKIEKTLKEESDRRELEAKNKRIEKEKFKSEIEELEKDVKSILKNRANYLSYVNNNIEKAFEEYEYEEFVEKMGGEQSFKSKIDETAAKAVSSNTPFAKVKEQLESKLPGKVLFSIEYKMEYYRLISKIQVG